MAIYKIADVVFELKTVYGYTHKLCEKYLYDGKPEFFIETTNDDINAEKINVEDFPDFYLESLAVYRKLCTKIVKDYNGFIFHSSALAVDGKAYIFTAPSGTGKSTHAKLWRELLGDKVIMVNDDKPIFRYIDGKFYVYGTPWDGKHRLSTNTRAEIKAIAQISQSNENFIKKATPQEIFQMIFNQTLRFEDAENMLKLLDLLDNLMSKVDLYTLGVNMDISSAQLSYGVMSGNTEI